MMTEMFLYNTIAVMQVIVINNDCPESPLDMLFVKLGIKAFQDL